ncbi:hypothetical protein BDV39DRAFT_107535 [Aspergillus sergii]|uniref:Uncharacterized protein n=1 Tax=Aspergillus sergii TaxID=1034303 RepID=A0A5N6XLM9_9EURO|nr:hypothetical protein BDV39DRAFT_107535 [Aspergillus sergii]
MDPIPTNIPFNTSHASVETPLPDSDDPVDQGVRRIWEAMERVIRKSQQTVRHTGQAIRVEAVRSEKGQTLYRPLQAYMDADSVAKHVQPWQQILAFIALTQAPHTWKSPPYGTTPRQRRKWRQLWQCAIHPVDRATELIADSIHQRWIMSDIEQACLEFCIELLNQTSYVQEYKSVLICAMAVLGRGESGWRDVKSYPPILSRVIKIARFMIVQNVLWFMDVGSWSRRQVLPTDSACSGYPAPIGIGFWAFHPWMAARLVSENERRGKMRRRRAQNCWCWNIES